MSIGSWTRTIAELARLRPVLPPLITVIMVCGCSEPPGPAAAPQTGDGSPAGPSQSCDALRQINPTGFDLDVVSTAIKAVAPSGRDDPKQGEASAPSATYCDVSGYFEKRAGVGGESYAIGFRLALPEQWNGRLLFQGGGGLNGVARDPIGAFAAGSTPALTRGFAVVTTDGGHQSETLFDTAFFADQKALLNFYGRAVVRTTQLARAIVSSYYGRPTKFAYFAGCSTGGREGLTMAQRYPELFDGIVVGAPAIRTNLSELADLFAAKSLRAVAPDGTDAPFSNEEQELIVNAIVAQCDANDGLADGLVLDVLGCDFEPASLQCPMTPSTTCLTVSQVDALDTAFAGPHSPDGRPVYPGFFYDTGIAVAQDARIPGLLQGVAGPLGRPRMNQPFDLERELSIAEASPLAPGNATLTNLSTFALEQNKLILFHGVSDPWFSARDTLGYYESLVRKNGGPEAVSRWSQFYLVPGMGHCSGGSRTLDSFDMLSAIVEWVEQGQRPRHVIATGDSMPGISRPLCPFPQAAHYTGDGDSDVAGSFECR